ncbi:MAG: YCF48-related protein [Desulfobacteraceae bacterium]|nr:YCF48-related protein [Desulfobacteraceae bacterium]
MTLGKPVNKEPALKKTFIAAVIAFILIATPLLGMAPVYGTMDLLLMPSPKIPIQMAVRMKFLDLTISGNRYVAVGEYGIILTSDNQGDTWQQAVVPTSVTLTAVYFPTAKKGWAVGHDGVVLNTQDAGETWQIQASGLEMNKKVLDQIDKKKAELTEAMKAAPEDSQEELAQRLQDMEYLHSDMSAPIEANAPTSLLDVFFMDEETGFAVGAFGMIIQTKNGGIDWEPIVDRMNNLEGYHYYGMESIRTEGRDILFLAGERGLLYRSMDRGTTWQLMESPHEGSFFGVKAANDRKTIILFGLGGLAFLSTDLGETWKDIEIPEHLPISCASPVSENRFLLTTVKGNLFFTKEDGTGVLPVSPAVPGTITAVETADGSFLFAGSVGIKKITVSDRKED